VSSVGLQPDPQLQTRPNHTPNSNLLHVAACGFLLAVLSLALYYPARSHPFVNYDDNLYVTDNENIKGGLTWDTVTWAMTTYEAGNWHPLTWLSHALDFQLYGMDPAGHHQTNLLLHALNATLVFWVLLGATRRAGPSLMVAALFAVHPLNVEPVVWVAERKTVLSMTFFLLALGAYNHYAAKPRLTRYLPVALLFALGLMAKPQIITFPFVLLLWDYWPLQRISLGRDGGEVQREPQSTWRALIAEKLPLFAIAAGSAALTMQAQRSANAVLSFGAIPLSIRLSNAIVSYVRYLHKAFWPERLAPMYPHPGNMLPAWQVYGALLLLIAITLWVFEQRRHRYLLVGWLWFLGTLVPMIGLVQVGRQAMADRYAYVPLLGIFIMLCWGVADWFGAKRLPAALLPLASVLVVLALTIVARRQIGYWADNLVLWTHTIEVTPPNYIAEDNLGATLLARKRSEEAIVHFRQAAALHPTDPISVFNIGFYEQQHGNLQQAIDNYRQAIILTTRTQLKVLALQNMGHAYSDLGDADHARECFDAARKMQSP
jgi:tetratricopeptide (TPR) repeat protein